MLNNKSDASVAENSATTAVHFRKEAFAISLFSIEYGCSTLPPIFQTDLLHPPPVAVFFFFFLNGTCQVLLVTEDRTLIIGLGQGKE